MLLEDRAPAQWSSVAGEFHHFCLKWLGVLVEEGVGQAWASQGILSWLSSGLIEIWG